MEGGEGLGRVPHKGTFTSLGTERPTGFGGTGSKKRESRVELKRASNPPLFRFRVNPVGGICVKERGARFELRPSVLKEILEFSWRPFAHPRDNPSFPTTPGLGKNDHHTLGPKVPHASACVADFRASSGKGLKESIQRLSASEGALQRTRRASASPLTDATTHSLLSGSGFLA